MTMVEFKQIYFLGIALKEMCFGGFHGSWHLACCRTNMNKRIRDHLRIYNDPNISISQCAVCVVFNLRAFMPSISTLKVLFFPLMLVAKSLWMPLELACRIRSKYCHIYLIMATPPFSGDEQEIDWFTKWAPRSTGSLKVPADPQLILHQADAASPGSLMGCGIEQM